MAYNKTEQKTLELVTPICARCGLSVWDVEFKKEGPDYFLRVFLDRAGGVSIDDCEAVSRELDAALDKADPIPQAYVLEVCSAGLDRSLTKPEHFAAMTGREVDVKLYAPLDGEKEFCAVLEGMEDGNVVLRYKGNVMKLSRNQFSSIRLAVQF